ncbi:MAG: ABC transporter substrate-binding protein [bacterium]
MRSLQTVVMRSLIGLALVLVVVAACGPGPTTEPAPAEPTKETEPAPAEPTKETEPAPTEPAKEEVVLSLGLDPQNLDPLEEGGGGGLEVNIENNMFDTLLRRDDDMNVIPWVAESWEALDETTWEFKIREGIKFHNGEELDAEAVKYTWDVLRRDDPEINRVLQSWYKPVERVEVVDKYTVQFITSEPYPVLTAYMTSRPMIVPPEYYEETWRAGGRDDFSLQPIGSGPYRFVEFVPDDHLTLEAFEDYWRGEPAIPRVTYRPIAEAGTMLAEFLTGGLDLIINVAPEHIPEIEAQRGVIDSTPSVQVLYAMLRTDRIPERKVRQALFYAADVDTMIESILGGYAVKLKYGAAVTPEEFGYDPSIEPYPYDPEKARELLADVGWEDTDGDGVRERDGDELELSMVTSTGRNPRQGEIAQSLAAYWEDVGIRVNLRLAEYSTWREEFISRGFDEDVWIESTGTRTFDADARLINMVHSYKTVEEDGYSAGIVSYYWNDEVDRKIQEARSIVDQEEREKLYHEILAQLHRDAYHMALYQQVDIFAHHECLQGFSARADKLVWFGDMYWECP